MRESDEDFRMKREFFKLIRRSKNFPKDFFALRCSLEEYPFFNRTRHISFLNKYPLEKREYFLLKYSLAHLERLITYFCDQEDDEVIKKTFIALSILDWDYRPINPRFIVSFDRNAELDWLKLQSPNTPEAKYIENMIQQMGLTSKIQVYEIKTDSFERIYIGFKEHPTSNLITLDHYVNK